MRIMTSAVVALAALWTPAAAHAETLNLICNADVAICELMKTEFEKETSISVNMVRLSSGETFAKIRAEARNPKTDIWWAGTGDPHLQAASEGLTLEYKSPMLDKLQPWAKKQAEQSELPHGRRLFRRARLGLQHRYLRQEGPQGAQMLGRPHRSCLQGRDPDGQSELVGHRLYGARHPRPDHGRGPGFRVSQEAQREHSPVHQVRARRRSRPRRAARPGSASSSCTTPSRRPSKASRSSRSRPAKARATRSAR